MGAYKDMRERHEKEIDEYLVSHAFFAIDDERFAHGLERFGLSRQQVNEGVLRSLGAGMYMLTDRVSDFFQLMDAQTNEIRNGLDDRDFAYEFVAYQGDIHEFSYTRDAEKLFGHTIPDILDMSADEVIKDARISEAFSDYKMVIAARERNEAHLEMVPFSQTLEMLDYVRHGDFYLSERDNVKKKLRKNDRGASNPKKKKQQTLDERTKTAQKNSDGHKSAKRKGTVRSQAKGS
jgi:hypothetical protein